MTEEVKVCIKCGGEKPLHLFPKRYNTHHNTCKECKVIYERSRRKIHSKEINAKLLEKRRPFRKQLNVVSRVYYHANKEKYNTNKKEWWKRVKLLSLHDEKYMNIMLRKRLSCRIQKAVKDAKTEKCQTSTILLGCSVDECRKYLESKFLPGMSWDNIGEWHIDHIIPCASFDLTKPEEQLKCFHYTNLQPLWSGDNISKSDRIQVLTSEGLFLV